MKAFTKVINPCLAPAFVAQGYGSGGKMQFVQTFCKIAFDGKRLSITGVVGPTSDGNCWGSCGQIDSSLREDRAKLKLNAGWDDAMFDKFLSVWDEWHLNDTRAYDAEMLAAGWREKARTAMRGYKFNLRYDPAIKAQNAAKERVEALLKQGQMAQYTAEELQLIHMPYEVTLWRYAEEPEPAPPTPMYERAKTLRDGSVEPPAHKTLGWLYPKDHPDGLLGRKLREDGPGYGCVWFFAEVPADVLQWLHDLPATVAVPAWV